MATYCENCGKRAMYGNQVARARQELLYRSPKVFKPNLHNARIPQTDGSTIRVSLCTKCLRAVKKEVAEMMALKSKTSKAKTE
jgi:ribosomal protein L28